MPRFPRQVLPGQPLHIVQRGNNRAACFTGTDDYRFYLDALRDACAQTRCSLHAYVLMRNHVHLLVTPRDAIGPARLMQSLGRRFVRYFNASHGRTGTLWEGRYRSSVIDSERYFLACSRYIELNPVRAGLVHVPAAYRWTSFHRNAHGETDRLIAPHAVYRALGDGDRARERAYRALFATELDVAAVDAIREAAWSGRLLRDAEAKGEAQVSAGSCARSKRRRL